MTAPDPLDATRHMWTVGSYPTMGDVFAGAGRDLVATVGVEGLDVLDVACGTGNTALAAARAGAASVVGVDVTPALLEEARRRAAADDLPAHTAWHEADMATLPVADAAHDRVLSTFGAMFAADHARVAGELLRACRPGGVVAVTAWSHGGLFDQMTGALVGHLSAAPPPGPSPRDWADPDHLTTVFGMAPTTFEERVVGWDVASVEAAVALVEEASGPVIMLRQALGDGWPAAQADLAAVFADASRATPDGASLPLRYRVATFTGS